MSHIVSSIAALEAIYGEVNPRAIQKEISWLNEDYQAFVKASPFIVLASIGEGGMDCSPKGDPTGFVRILNERTLAIPDRPGNNRIDNLRNIVADPRVSVLFLIPGKGECLRVNGRAQISIDPELLAQFEVQGKVPRTAIVVEIDAAYFHCSKAVARSKLWDQASQAVAATLPSTGAILNRLMTDGFDGAAYDRDAPERIRTTLY